MLLTTTEEIREKAISVITASGMPVSQQAPAYLLYSLMCSMRKTDCKNGRSKKWYYKTLATMLMQSHAGEKIGSFLVSIKAGRKAHIWNGSDTACKMFATGGLYKKNYIVAEQTSNDICELCLASNRHHRMVKKEPVLKVVPPKKKAFVTNNFYDSDEWRALRYKALELNGGACQCCGRTRKHGVVLHVDHIKPRSLYPELELRLDNLQVLCEDCNMGKSNKFATDWR